jgi:hypothetical protein
MLTQRLTSENQLYEILVPSTGVTRNGSELYIDDDMAPTPLDANDTVALTFVIQGNRNLRGTHEIIPDNRAVFVTEYTGVYVSPEDQGFMVNVPVKGTRRERKELAWYQQPERLRYYAVDELKGYEIDVASLALRAAARGVYEVANGINMVGHLERVHAMSDNSKVNIQLSAVVEEESNSIWKALYSAEPELQEMDTKINQLSLEDPRLHRAELIQLWTSFWTLRDQTLARLGLTERFNATLTRIDDIK